MDINNAGMVTKGEGGGIHWEIVINIYILLHTKYITNKGLL